MIRLCFSMLLAVLVMSLFFVSGCKSTTIVVGIEKDVDFEKVRETKNIKLDQYFYNDESDTYVWTGHFVDEQLTLSEEEKLSDLILEAGEVIFEMEVEDGPEFRFGISVYPGSNSFVKVIVREPKSSTTPT